MLARLIAWAVFALMLIYAIATHAQGETKIKRYLFTEDVEGSVQLCVAVPDEIRRQDLNVAPLQCPETVGDLRRRAFGDRYAQ